MTTVIPPGSPHYVYSLYDRRTGITKIGMSYKPRHRISAVRTEEVLGWPFDGLLASILQFPDIGTAWRFERQYTRLNCCNWLRVRGVEWFWTGTPIVFNPVNVEHASFPDELFNKTMKRIKPDTFDYDYWVH